MSSTFTVINPATGLAAGEAPLGTPAQFDEAVVAAEAAGHGWRADENSRQHALIALADAIVDNQHDLAALLTLETGKPVAVAAFEPAVCATWLRVFAGMDIPPQVLQDDTHGALLPTVPYGGSK